MPCGRCGRAWKRAAKNVVRPQLKRRATWRYSRPDVLSALSHAWSSWKTAPGVAVLAVIAFAVGIGSATAIFTVINGVLLRPLPYPDGGRFVSLYAVNTTSPGVFRTNQTNAVFVPGALLPGTTYYWRVDESGASGTVTGQVWSFTTAAANRYEWHFGRPDFAASLGAGTLSYADGSVTSNLVSFGQSDGMSVPHIAGYPVRYLHVPAFTAAGNGLLATFSASGPNGGGVYLNQFTLIWDLLVPAPLGYVPLFNTNPQNANDADFYIDPTGSVGTGAIGYSGAGALSAGAWHRLAFAADLSAGVATYAVDGAVVFAGSAGAALDGRYSLYSNVDPGADLLLFNEGNSGGVYTHALLVSSFAFVDRTLATAELLALGGPSDLGIFLEDLPPLSVAQQGVLVNCRWQGSLDVRLQAASRLDAAAVWEDVPGTRGESFYSTEMTNQGMYFRLIR